MRKLATNNQKDIVNSEYIAPTSAEVAPESTNQVQEEQDIFTFANDLAVVPEHVPGETTLPGVFNDQHTVADNLSIISFMQRPQLIKSLAWTSEHEVGYNLLPVDLRVPDVNLTKMLKNKLDGITSFRATAVLRLQFQTQPFQCGRLIFAAIPMPTLIQPRNRYIRSHPSLLQSINHVQVDINKHTEISLRIPFISPFNSYNLVDNKYPWAELVLMVYSALKDPQKMTVPIRLYSHFEDIELGAPCSSELGKPDAEPVGPKPAECTEEEIIDWVIKHPEKFPPKEKFDPKKLRNYINYKKEGQWHFAYTFDDGKVKHFDTWDMDAYRYSRPSTQNSLQYSRPWKVQEPPGTPGGLGFNYCRWTPTGVDTSEYIDASHVGPIGKDANGYSSEPASPTDPCPNGFEKEDGTCENIGTSSSERTIKDNLIAPLEPMVIQQSGRPKKQASAAQVKASRSSEVGGIVQPLSKGAGIIYDGIGNALPFLKPVTDVFSQLAGLGGQFIGNLFGWLGFSKPQTNYAGFNVLPRPTEFFCNANGVDHSHVLALDKLNGIDEFPGLGGTSFDEMDMNYIIRIPQWIGSFTYKNILEEGKPLFSTYVSPNYYIPGNLRITNPTNISAPVVIAEHQEKQPTNLNYITSFFMYWTGSLTYTLRFMKTSFHSGRVRISFHPFTNTVDRDRLDYVYNTIVDLRENSEVSFTIPYVAPQPWKRVRFQDANNYDPVGRWEEYGPGVTGRLEVNPITPLICSNPQVSTEIECVVEVRAGDDFQVMAPVRSGFFPFNVDLTVPQSRGDATQIAVQQSGVFALAGTQETRTSAIEGFTPISITTSGVDVHRTDTQKFCAGETFSNFRSLIKRFAFVEKVKFKPKEETIQRKVFEYLQPPPMEQKLFYAYTEPSKPPIQANLQGIFNQLRYRQAVSPLVAIGQMYTFYRGGLRIKVFTDQNPKLVSCRLVDSKDVIQRQPGKDGHWWLLQGQRRITPYNAPVAFEFTKEKGFAEFQIPFYSPVMIGVISQYSSASEFDKSSTVIDISSTNDIEGEELEASIAVAAADDFSFHGFLGTPPVININTINDYTELPPGMVTWDSQVSNVDTTLIEVDPCYPLNMFTHQGGDTWKDLEPGGKKGLWNPITDKLIPFCINYKGPGCPV